MDAITLAGGQRVAVRRSARARRMVLRVARAGGAAVLTLPPGATEAEARAFVTARAGWLAAVQARLPAAAVVGWGTVLPVAGEGLVVTPAAVRVCRVEAGALLAPRGRPPGPVVAVWLAARAREALAPLCRDLAGRLGAGARPLTALALRDTRSRWGSCTAEGRLMFNWRLAMAPPEVLAYVAAHEVAHLAHMDHSPRFWATVGALHSGYAAQRGWLRRSGPALQAWLFREPPAHRD